MSNDQFLLKPRNEHCRKTFPFTDLIDETNGTTSQPGRVKVTDVNAVNGDGAISHIVKSF